LKPREVDRCNVYRLLPKVTEPDAQNVKVSLATQVMSGVVGEGISTQVGIGNDNSTVSLNDTQTNQQWCYLVQLFM
jgi:hypothetical protein